MPTATPSSSSRPRPRQARAQTPPLPPYEPPQGPLHPTGHAKLITLLKSQSLRQLKTHLQHAEEKLTDSAGEVNERLTDSRVRYEKQKERRRQRAQQDRDGDDAAEDNEGDGDDGDDNGEEWDRLVNLQEQVQGVTGQLEEAMRRTIDAEVKVDSLAGVMGQFETEAEQASLRSGRRSQRRARTRREEDDEEGEGEGEDDEDYEATPEPQGEQDSAPSRKLDASLGESYKKWDRLSLTERYSTNNAYIGFYRMIHEAKIPGDDIPPLPHASTWFSHLEDHTSQPTSPSESHASPRRTRHQNQARAGSPASSDDDDIAIERERISLKCPLTLLPFQDPVTSTKCPHSFEREAIEGMIAQSGTTVPAPPGSRSRRVRSVKCPVCSAVLTAADLRSDPVLLRRVRRAEAALRRDAEADEEDEFDAEEGGRQRRRKGRLSGIMLASDDGDGQEGGMDVDEDESDRPDPVRIKRERVMSSQLTGQ